MKILLVVPPKDKDQQINLVPPLGLGYLATVLRKDHDVEIVDCPKEGMNLNDLTYRIVRFKPRVVGFTVFTSDVRVVEKCLLRIKKFFPGVLTLVGGPHISGTGKSLPNADYAFVGEAENRISEVLETQPETSVIQADFLDDIDHIPAWDLIEPETYQGVPNGMFTNRLPFAPMVVTRGCPYSCTFCTGWRNSGKKIRTRGISSVLHEIDILYKRGIREIHFEDDNFTFDIDYAKAVCTEIIKCGYKDLSFGTPNGIRIDRVDVELLHLMRLAGWYRIYVGIESGSEAVLDKMKKNLDKEIIREKLELVKRVGLSTAAYFILGYPGESDVDRRETIEFAKSLPLDLAQFAIFMPLPGAAITEELGITDFGDCFNTEGSAELKIWQDKAFREFYMRPRQIWTILKGIRRHNLKYILRRMAAYLR